MRIDSGLNGYYYQNRTVAVERNQEDAPQHEVPVMTRSPGALTGSSTLLSSSLASALWAVEVGEANAVSSQQQAEAEQGWVRNVYDEFN